jgi:phage baseplate assembly protein gpV
LHLEGTLTGLVDGDVNMTVLNNAKLDVRKNADIDIGGNITADVVGSMTASVQGATSLRGVDEDNVTLLSIDFDNAASKITLDSTDVEIKGKLKVFGTTTTGTGNLILDTHQHAGDGGDNSGPNTGGPANP